MNMVDLLQADGLYGGRSARDQNPVLKSAQNGCGIVRVDVGHLKYNLCSKKNGI